jgi:hypothetical protein
MDSFRIASYKVSTYIQRLPNETRFERLLELEAEPVAHGYVSRALLAFNTFFTKPWTNPVVGYLTFTPSSIDWINVAAWMDLGEFDYYYRILQSEKPVHFYYQRQNTGTFASGYLTKVGLGTGAEPVGEGPAESTYKNIMISPALQTLIDKAPKAAKD